MTKLNRIAATMLTIPGAGRLVLAPVARRGYRRYRSSGQTPRSAYVAMRKLYAADPVAFERLAATTSSEHPLLSLPQDPPGLLHGCGAPAMAALERDGLYVLPHLVSDAVCADLIELASKATCTLVGERVDGVTRAQFDPAHVIAPRYDVDEADLVRSDAVQRLMCDESLLALAQSYLRAAPVQDLVAMWWSAPVSGAPSSVAAQKFHFDLDRLRFLKLFVYLTDVDEKSGPHVFVRGTHSNLPGRFRQDHRHDDLDVESAFGSSLTTITGRRGTAFLADTRGLHKGMAVEHAYRLVFQMEYASSLFGTTCPRVDLDDVVPELDRAMSLYPVTFERFTVRSHAS